MQLAFDIAGVCVAVITVITSTIKVTHAIEAINLRLAVIQHELHHYNERIDRIERQIEAAARS